MRKIIVSEFVSVDNVFEVPGGGEEFKLGGWSLDYLNDEYGKFKYDELLAADTLLLGRKTYEGFANAWPDRSDEQGFADRMNSYPKYVLSTTLKNPSWQNTTVLSANIPEQIEKFKQQEGRNILVFGSGEILPLLLEHDLIDELILMIHPVVLGQGKTLLKNVPMTKLTLLDSKVFKTGTTVMTYGPAGKKEAAL